MPDRRGHGGGNEFLGRNLGGPHHRAGLKGSYPTATEQYPTLPAESTAKNATSNPRKRKSDVALTGHRGGARASLRPMGAWGSKTGLPKPRVAKKTINTNVGKLTKEVQKYPRQKKRDVPNKIQNGIDIARQDRMRVNSYHRATRPLIAEWIKELGDFKEMDVKTRLELLYLVALDNAPKFDSILACHGELRKLKVAPPVREHVVVPADLRNYMLEQIRHQRIDAARIGRNNAMLEGRKERVQEKLEDLAQPTPTMIEIEVDAEP